MGAFVTRLMLQNYKSIERCDLRLGPLTFLVGPNGSGKSNVLDSLRFTSDALNTSLDHAIRGRGGVGEVRRRSRGNPCDLGVRLDFRLPDGGSGHYSYRVGARENDGFRLTDEECVIRGAGGRSAYRVRDGTLAETTALVVPPVVPDRLHLVVAAGLPEFAALYDLLSRMSFFNLTPDRIRDLQPPDSGELLARDGGNLASVLRRLAREDPAARERVEQFLSRVVPGVRTVESRSLGPKETVEFLEGASAESAFRFYAANMSDGTLRALGVLVALFHTSRVPLVGIEEPEMALHPAAAGVLLDSLREASHRTQVVVTSHSPELLDAPGLDADSLLAVVAENGRTAVAAPDETGRSVLRDRLYTAGELLRMGQLLPDRTVAPQPPALFDLGGVP